MCGKGLLSPRATAHSSSITRLTSQGSAWQQFSCPASSSCLAESENGQLTKEDRTFSLHFAIDLTQSRRHVCRSGRTRTTALTEEDLLLFKANKHRGPSDAFRLRENTNGTKAPCIVLTRHPL